jgi:acetate---CoA ligase (ADP-forming)
LNTTPRVSSESWQALFNPKTVAVIGATNTPGAWGNNSVKGLMGFKDRQVFPVNPKSPEVLGLKAYPSVKDIPGPVDLAIIVVAEKLVPGVMRECVAKGVRSAVIITSGFGEMGAAGKKLEKEIADIARKGGIHFIGPNSMGHTVTSTGLTTFGQLGKSAAGNVAVLAQSGSTCLRIAHSLEASGIAPSMYISTGNEADLTMEDYLEYLAEDKNTKLIAAYIEGLRDGRRFYELARRITPHKPIVVLKAGGTATSAKAVMSHTGALAGADNIHSAAFKQSGVIRVEDEDELIDVVYALMNCPLPHGPRAGILSVGGGPGALMAEAVEKEGLTIGELEPSTITKLDGLLSTRWPRRNPVDMAGPSGNDMALVSSLLFALMDDKNLDFIMLNAPLIIEPGTFAKWSGLDAEGIKTQREKQEKTIQAIREKAEQYEKPVVMMWQAHGFTSPEVTALFRQGRFIICSNARRASRILKYLAWYRQYITNAAETHVSPLSTKEKKTGKTTLLTEIEAKAVTKDAGINVTDTRLAVSAQQAVDICKETGYPAVLKIASPDITHKTDAGGVKTGLKDAKEVQQAYDAILASVKAKFPHAKIDGVTVQPMARPGVEIIIGMFKDPQFGPVIMFGLGGIFVEVLKDVAFRLIPIARRDAEEMIEEIKGKALLNGYRGQEPAGKVALVDALLKVSALVEKSPDIKELDLNPVFAYNDSIIAVDARIVLEGK